MDSYRFIFKRIFDVLAAAIAVVVLLPLMILISLVVFLNVGVPFFFSQQRPGYHGKPFVIYKFRTMMNLYDADGNLLPDDKRLTRVGHFLRNTSLDELPEFFNVLRGEMSLVGPR